MSPRRRRALEHHHVPQNEFYRLLATKVLAPVVGKKLTLVQIHDLVYGLSDVVIQLALEGGKVQLGHLGLFRINVMAPGQCWDPARRRKVKIGERRKLMFRTSKPTRRLINS